VAIGQADGAAFVEITKNGTMDYLGRLPAFSRPAIWRELRGYKDYMVIGSESDGHGLQIFDMKKLLDLSPASPKTFDKKADLTGHYTGLPIGRTHNVVVNEDSDFVYAVGAMPRTDKCKGGLIFVNMTDPTNPTSPGCAAMDGYVHDAQCVIYQGPHTKYVGREVCYGYNEDSLTMLVICPKHVKGKC
jgi:choice-of-anchor B domain-containing protein